MTARAHRRQGHVLPLETRTDAWLLKAAKARQECLAEAAQVPTWQSKLSARTRARGHSIPQAARAPALFSLPPEKRAPGSVVPINGDHRDVPTQVKQVC